MIMNKLLYVSYVSLGHASKFVGCRGVAGAHADTAA